MLTSTKKSYILVYIVIYCQVQRKVIYYIYYNDNKYFIILYCQITIIFFQNITQHFLYLQHAQFEISYFNHQIL